MGTRGLLKQFRRSIIGRMMVGLLAVQIILTPVLFYGILSFIERGFQSQFVDQVRKSTYHVATIIKPAVVQLDLATQEEVLSEALLGEDLVLAELISADGTYIRPLSNQILSDTNFREDFEFGQQGDNVYYIAIPIVNDQQGDLLGTLRFGYDEVPTQDRINVAYRYGALLALVYTAFSILIAIFFGRRLAKPVSQLQDLAKSIANGETTTGLTVDTNIREINSLADDLEMMRQNLVDRHRDVMDREKRLSTILDNAGEGIIAVDDKGVIGSFNHAAESIFGYTAGEVIGERASLLLPSTNQGQDSVDLGYYLASAGQSARGVGHRIESQHQDGHIIPVYLTVTEIYLDQEHLYICIVHDLTREEEREEQLLKFWRIVEQSPIAIIITDDNGVIEYVNPYFCQLTGYQAEEAFGKDPGFIGSGNTHTDTYQEMWNTISGGETWRGVFQNIKKNGELFWSSATICPVHDQNNNITHYIALNEDITRHRERDRMLTQAMKMEVVGRMTDGISHDFKNLLTIILGNLSYLKKNINTIGRVESVELISDVISAANDGSNLIKQLLVFSRQTEPDARPMELAEFMTGSQKLIRKTVPEDIDLELRLSEDVGTVHIDANRLESAVLNLVINARDALTAGGKILITVDQDTLLEPEEVEGGFMDPGDYVFLRVIDNGTGMSKEVRQKVLVPFFTTKPGSTGTGLGMSMVTEFVTKTGGGMQIESELDVGTTVTLILPLYKHAKEISTYIQ